MTFSEWVDKRIKKLRWFDISLIKASVFVFVLMLVKFWPSLIYLDWYWYFIIFLVFAIRPLYVTLLRK